MAKSTVCNSYHGSAQYFPRSPSVPPSPPAHKTPGPHLPDLASTATESIEVRPRKFLTLPEWHRTIENFQNLLPFKKQLHTGLLKLHFEEPLF